MMANNEQTMNAIVDELKEIGLKKMAEELDVQYNSPDFLKLDRVELIRKIVESEYVDRANKRLATRLQLGHLKDALRSFPIVLIQQIEHMSQRVQ